MTPGGGAARARAGGVLLAAGASRRMGGGTSKMLLALDGEPLVRRQAARARAAGLDPLVVVLGHQAEAVRDALAGLDCVFTLTADPMGPTSGSLHAGLHAMPPDVHAAVVMLGDMPRVSTAMLVALLDADRGTNAPLVVSRYGDDGVLAPPLLFRRALWPELLAWHGEGCGKAVVNAHRDEAALLDWPADALQDIDTPADYEALRR